MKMIRILISVFLPALLVACGGSDSGSGSYTYDGNTNPATIDGSNSNAFGNGVAEASANSGVDTSDNPIVTISTASSSDLSNGVSRTIVNSAKYSKLAATTKLLESEPCLVSGSISANIPGLDASSTSLPSSGSATITFDNCNNSDAFFGTNILDGVIELTWTGYDELTETFATASFSFNMTYQYDSGTDYANFTVQCTGTTCSFNGDFTENGIGYRVENFVATEHSGGLVDFSYRFYHYDYGYVDVEGYNIDFDDTGEICSGTILVIDSTASTALTINYTSCGFFTIN